MNVERKVEMESEEVEKEEIGEICNEKEMGKRIDIKKWKEGDRRRKLRSEGLEMWWKKIRIVGIELKIIKIRK